ncbi:hypothetical protein [Chryseobacterium sp. SN22]|nr:hypothetical protein [Chryseobacterium sp. SN22]
MQKLGLVWLCNEIENPQKISWKLGVCVLLPAENQQQDKPIEI